MQLHTLPYSLITYALCPVHILESNVVLKTSHSRELVVDGNMYIQSSDMTSMFAWAPIVAWDAMGDTDSEIDGFGMTLM